MAGRKRRLSETTSSSNRFDFEDYCSSELKFKKYKLHWTIKNFEFICNNMKVIESPKFPSTKAETVKWYLKLEPVEITPENPEEFMINLKNIDNSHSYLSADIYLSSPSGKTECFTSEFDHFEAKWSWTKTGAELYNIFASEDGSLPQNLTVTCKLWLLDSGITTIDKPMDHSLKTDGLMNQLEYLFEDQIFNDVKFIVEDDEFTAHKAILAARSPVFAAMFKNKMKEEITSIVKIEDINSDIFQLMLRFIYTDEVENLEESAVELFYAADKYDLKKLRSMCVESMYKNVSADNVMDILTLANAFSIRNLQVKAVDYYVSNIKRFENCEKFGKIMENQPDFAAFMQKMQEYIDSKRDSCDYTNAQKMTFKLRRKL